MIWPFFKPILLLHFKNSVFVSFSDQDFNFISPPHLTSPPRSISLTALCLSVQCTIMIDYAQLWGLKLLFLPYLNLPLPSSELSEMSFSNKIVKFVTYLFSVNNGHQCLWHISVSTVTQHDCPQQRPSYPPPCLDRSSFPRLHRLQIGKASLRERASPLL